jgi:hypothetical protein
MQEIKISIEGHPQSEGNAHAHAKVYTTKHIVFFCYETREENQLSNLEKFSQGIVCAKFSSSSNSLHCESLSLSLSLLCSLANAQKERCRQTRQENHSQHVSCLMLMKR